MCGICGYIRFDRYLDEEDGTIIEKMNRKLIHRGPDAQHTVVSGPLALGFSRLSIIGLENGMQPIPNEDGSIVLVCNGEIFNYIELREQLRSRGHFFSTGSDVEVLVHLYEEHGMGLLEFINGQFAFALYDKTKRTLYCARDQMGIAPLFYTLSGNVFIFSSEIKAILAHPLAPREIDPTGLDQVLTFAGLISPRTMFRNISSLENGHYIAVNEQGQLRKQEYWDLIYPEAGQETDGKPESYYVEQLEELFNTAVRLRLRSDVPSGLYLSGGLDSSMIAMKVQELHPGIRKEAFSIDFIESQYSESFYQRLVAQQCNARLNQKVFLFEDISTRLRHSVYHSECPIKETYNTASLSLSEAVRASGIKVILSGEGADELFAGYVGYRFDKLRAMNMVTNECSPAEAKLRDRLWGDPAFYYERNFLDFDVVKKELYSAGLSASFGEINCLEHPVVNRDRIAGRNIINKRAYIDYKIRLVDHLVSDHGDRMALANSVEVRYPFLDKELIAFSTRVPAHLKLNDFTEKYILRKMAARFMQREVCEREKFHFIAPGSPYLLQKNIPYIDDLLSYDLIRRQGYFDPDQVEKLKKIYSTPGFAINAPFESDLLITVITFGMLQDLYFR